MNLQSTNNLCNGVYICVNKLERIKHQFLLVSGENKKVLLSNI